LEFGHDNPQILKYILKYIVFKKVISVQNRYTFPGRWTIYQIGIDDPVFEYRRWADTFSLGGNGSSGMGRPHNHHQQHLKVISKVPSASVVADPTELFPHHHHQESTSKASTSAPGTGLPSAQTTFPLMV